MMRFTLLTGWGWPALWWDSSYLQGGDDQHDGEIHARGNIEIFAAKVVGEMANQDADQWRHAAGGGHVFLKIFN